MMAAKDRNTPPGPGVDASGQTVMDPTVNVKERVDLEMQHVRELLIEKERRQDDLRRADSRRLTELAELRADYDEKIAAKESQRIDSNRAVDIDAARADRVTAENRAQTLAATVASTAEATRQAQEAARAAAATALAAETEPIKKDVADARRTQYETAGGKAQVVEGRAGSANWGLWAGLAAAVVLGMGTIVLGALGLIITAVGIYLATRP